MESKFSVTIEDLSDFNKVTRPGTGAITSLVPNVLDASPAFATIVSPRAQLYGSQRKRIGSNSNSSKLVSPNEKEKYS